MSNTWHLDRKLGRRWAPARKGTRPIAAGPPGCPGYPQGLAVGVAQGAVGLGQSWGGACNEEQSKLCKTEVSCCRQEGGGALAGAVPASLRGRGQAPVQPLREVPQLRQEVAQVDLVFIAQGAALGKEKWQYVRADSRIQQLRLRVARLPAQAAALFPLPLSPT